MILIVSEKSDVTTKEVVEWLLTRNLDYLIITPETKIELNIINGKYVLNVECKKFNLEKVSSVYFRRALIQHVNAYETNRVYEGIRDYNFAYRTDISTFLGKLLKHKKSIGKHAEGINNKLDFLHVCQQLSIQVPHYAVVSKKNDLNKFIKKYGKTITKSISLPYHFIDYDNCKSEFSYTKEITKDELKIVPDQFNPSFIQVMIDKKFEIRVFYINKQIYSMAIFSQDSEEGKIDFRLGYGDSKMRYSEIKLPRSLNLTIVKLMEKLEYNIGCIDIIYGRDKKFYFLELNPMGQYGWQSDLCSYNLEKIVSEELHG